MCTNVTNFVFRYELSTLAYQQITITFEIAYLDFKLRYPSLLIRTCPVGNLVIYS
jgi:hypothetical protein